MEKKQLFCKDDQYTPDALELDREVLRAVEPIFKSWRKNGFSIRDISHIAMATISSMECHAATESLIESWKRDGLL